MNGHLCCVHIYGSLLLMPFSDQVSLVGLTETTKLTAADNSLVYKATSGL